MIASSRGRTDITNILLEGEHIDFDIQENVRQHAHLYGQYFADELHFITTENSMVIFSLLL